MYSNKEILKKTMENAINGGIAVLYTVISADEMAGIQPGARLLVCPGGEKHGTLGLTSLDKTMLMRAENIFSRATPHTEIITWPLSRGNIKILEDTYFSPKKLLILGGGHIAVPLAQMATILGYKTVIVDDRPEFANKQRFPLADEIICADFEVYLSRQEINLNTSVVIITRGHAYDYQCLASVINSPARYIGMIGSTGKVRHIFKLLLNQGISREKLQGIAAPIGLDLGGQKPAEIALGILAEMIARENNGTGKPMSALKAVVVETK